MLLSSSVSDIDIFAEQVNGVVRSSTNIVDVFIPAKFARYDDTEVLSVMFTHLSFCPRRKCENCRGAP